MMCRQVLGTRSRASAMALTPKGCWALPNSRKIANARLTAGTCRRLGSLGPEGWGLAVVERRVLGGGRVGIGLAAGKARSMTDGGKTIQFIFVPIQILDEHGTRSQGRPSTANNPWAASTRRSPTTKLARTNNKRAARCSTVVSTRTQSPERTGAMNWVCRSTVTHGWRSQASHATVLMAWSTQVTN